MESTLFIITALVAVFAALMVITRKAPVSSVLFLVLTFFCLAVLYVMLGAQFIAALQVIVYAGAIMVLFLFVVMMLDLGEAQKWEIGSPLRIGLGFAAAGGVLLIAVTGLRSALGINAPLEADMGTVAAIGEALFTRFLLPFEIASVLLLTAIIGAVTLVKRRSASTETGRADIPVRQKSDKKKMDIPVRRKSGEELQQGGN